MIYLNGEEFGTIHSWERIGDSGANVNILKHHAKTVEFMGRDGEKHTFYVTHVFLPEDLPEGFTVIGTRGKR